MEMMSKLWIVQNFLSLKGITLPEIIWNLIVACPAYSHDTCISKSRISIQNVYVWLKIELFQICESKGHNSAKNVWSKYTFDLHTLMIYMYLYPDFLFKMSTYDWNNE